MKKISDFAKLFWANRGNHSEMTSQKFVPDFGFEELQKAAAAGLQEWRVRTPYADQPALASADAVTKEVSDLKASLFDPNFEPMNTAKISARRQGHYPGERQHLL